MKKLLFTVLSVLLFGAAHAQHLPVKADVGVKIGANFTQLGGDSWVNTYQPGIHGGVILGVRKHKVGVQVEALISTAHYSTQGLFDSVKKGDFRATYFDIPVMFEYRVIGGKLLPKVWVMAGPQFSNVMSIKTLNDFAGDAKSTFKSGYFAGVVGVEIRYMKFTLGGRYVLGLTSINNENVAAAKGAWNSRTGQVYLGFRFI